MNSTEPHATPPAAAPVPRPKRFRGLPVAAWTAWLSAVVLVLLLWAQWRRGSMHPAVIPVLVLLLTLTSSTLVVVGSGLWRIARGPRRPRVAAWLLLGMVPALAIGIPVEKARRGWAHRDAPAGG